MTLPTTQDMVRKARIARLLIEITNVGCPVFSAARVQAIHRLPREFKWEYPIFVNGVQKCKR